MCRRTQAAFEIRNFENILFGMGGWLTSTAPSATVRTRSAVLSATFPSLVSVRRQTGPSETRRSVVSAFGKKIEKAQELFGH